MRELQVLYFLEDTGHEKFIPAILRRLADEFGVPLSAPQTRSVFGGHGRVIAGLKDFVRGLECGRPGLPGLLVVATDANCKGLQERRREVEEVIPEALRPFTVCAIPDPHVERWMLLDSAAFKNVFLRGCEPPDFKCEKDRYKRLLRQAIETSGVRPLLGGMEFSEDVVAHMDLKASVQRDRSLNQFVRAVEERLKAWERDHRTVE